MKLTIVLAFFCWTVASCQHKAVPAQAAASKGRRIDVSSSTTLRSALQDAKPGDMIVLKDGIYQGNFEVLATESGTADNPITLRGSSKAILDGGTTDKGYVLHLSANYWHIKGITIQHGLKGIMTDEAAYNYIDSVTVQDIGEEGIHFRRFSRHNVLSNSTILRTGLKTADYGEGVYIGTAISNWAKYTDGQEDRSDSNLVVGNIIGPNCTAECIDIKEGTTGNVIRRNKFDATGITGANSADSWMDVKGNETLIENNSGFNPAGSVLMDGFQVHCAAPGWGNRNRFVGNTATVNSAGYGFLIALTSKKGKAEGNVVTSDNKVTNAARGIANIPLDGR